MVVSQSTFPYLTTIRSQFAPLLVRVTFVHVMPQTQTWTLNLVGQACMLAKTTFFVSITLLVLWIQNCCSSSVKMDIKSAFSIYIETVSIFVWFQYSMKIHEKFSSIGSIWFSGIMIITHNNCLSWMIQYFTYVNCSLKLLISMTFCLLHSCINSWSNVYCRQTVSEPQIAGAGLWLQCMGQYMI